MMTRQNDAKLLQGHGVSVAMDRRLRRLHRDSDRPVLLLQLLRLFADRAEPRRRCGSAWITITSCSTTRSSGNRWATRSITPRWRCRRAMLVSLGLALMLNANIRGQTVYRAIIFLPSLVPAIASAMIWLWMFNDRAWACSIFCWANSALPPAAIGWAKTWRCRRWR